MAYSTETWSKVKTDYETGSYSVEQLSKNYSISEPAIKLKIKNEEWIKGKIKEKIQEKVEERTIDKLARLGMPEDKVLKVMVEGLEAFNMKWIKNPNYVEGGHEDQYIPEEIPDQMSRAKFFDMWCKMTGNYAPEKQEIKTEQDIKMSNEDLKDLSTEELQAMQSIMQKLGK